MHRLSPIAAVMVLALAPATAEADSMSYLSYDADTEAAKWRTGDVTLAIRKRLLTRRIDVLFRRKGSDLPLHPSNAPFTEADLRPFLGDRDPGSVRLYAVDKDKGAKFTGFACEGQAETSWVAISNPKPYKPLSIWVVRWDAEKAAPALCVAMDYRYRGEWRFPSAPGGAPEATAWRGAR